jgi:hypothetical protein
MRRRLFQYRGPSEAPDPYPHTLTLNAREHS